MNGITHKHAINLIHRRLDGLLKENQLLSLEEHLRSCDSCRLYAAEMDLLPARLQTQFHIRWDEKPGPSQKVIEHVTTKARNIPMTNRISSSVKLFAGAAALVLTALLVNFVVSQLRSTSLSGTETGLNNSVTPASSLEAENRLLAFTSEQNGNLDIYTMRPDGSGLTNITNNPANDVYPFWSPDGKRIAFVSDRDDSRQIYLMNADGSNVIQLTQGEGNHQFDVNGYSPWSPNGRKLIFSYKTPEERYWKLYVMNINEKTNTTLTNEPGEYILPSWSPDGEYIAFISAPSDQTPREIFVVDKNGDNLTQLTETLPRGENFIFSDYSWSQDGNSITFTTDKATVYKASLDGSLTVITRVNKFMVDWWNGTALLDDPEDSLTWLRSDGSESTLELCQNNGHLVGITHKRSYDGNLVIGANCSVSGWMLYWANADGTSTNKLLNSPISADNNVYPFNIAWSPDNHFLTFVALDDSPDATDTLYILDVAEARKDPSMQPVKMSNSFGPSWQPVPAPELVDNSPEIALDQESCKSASEVDSALPPPSELDGYELIQGTSLVDGDFSYEFWLYCDPSLKPNDQEHFSAVSGLGVYASWHYTGPQVEGENQYYYEFEPNIPLGRTAWNGPFNNVSATGARFGVALSETTVQKYIQQGIPIKFRAIIDSPLGQDGATLSFKLEPTERGYTIVDLHADPFNHAYEGLIAFTSEQNGNSDIYTMHADGSGLTNITNNAAHDAQPIWSPDGKYIAFESNRNGFMQIYLMDANGSNVIQFTNDRADHSLPLNIDGNSNPWSPDGSKLLFLQSSSGGELGNLYAKEVNRENKVLLASGRFSHNDLSWSPNGTYIAYVLNESPTPNETFVTGLYVVDSNGNNPQELKKLIPQNENLGSPYYWSSDGQSIVFITDKNDGLGQTVYEFDLETNTLLQKDMLKQGIIDWQETISLVNERSAFVWQRSDGTSNTLDWDDPNCLLDITRSLHGNFAIGAYCPDSKKFKLYWANSDGSTIKQLLDSPTLIGQLWDITWSPDDQYVAFNIISDKTSMYILDVREALKNPSIEPEQVPVSSTEFYTIPSWQPVP